MAGSSTRRSGTVISLSGIIISVSMILCSCRTLMAPPHLTVSCHDPPPLCLLLQPPSWSCDQVRTCLILLLSACRVCPGLSCVAPVSWNCCAGCLSAVQSVPRGLNDDLSSSTSPEEAPEDGTATFLESRRASVFGDSPTRDLVSTVGDIALSTACAGIIIIMTITYTGHHCCLPWWWLCCDMYSITFCCLFETEYLVHREYLMWKTGQ